MKKLYLLFCLCYSPLVMSSAINDDQDAYTNYLVEQFAHEAVQDPSTLQQPALVTPKKPIASTQWTSVLADSIQAVSALKKQQKDMAETIKEQYAGYGKAVLERQQLEEQLEKIQKERAIEQQLFAEIVEKISAIQAENQEIDTHNEQIAAENREKLKQLQTLLTTKNHIIENYQEKLTEYDEKLPIIQQHITENSEKNKQLVAELTKKQTELQELQSQILTLRYDKVQIMKQQRVLEQNIDEKANTITNLTQQKTALEQQINEKTTTITTLTQEQENLYLVVRNRTIALIIAAIATACHAYYIFHHLSTSSTQEQQSLEHDEHIMTMLATIIDQQPALVQASKAGDIEAFEQLVILGIQAIDYTIDDTLIRTILLKLLAAQQE